MASAGLAYSPGQRIQHAEFGEGVVVAPEQNGLVRVFFGVGERQVPADALHPLLTETERILAGVEGTARRLKQVWLSIEARSLPLMEGASSLTSANIDLLPHQVVLTHRVATASPRRYLIADEVGLGKTIETALVLRELHGRGELERALMVVPAGLVNNWHRELNEVFHLDFEVFGSSGDVTDRRSNAFAKHNRLIASIDTLKRASRVRRLLEAPAWDLVVFDEAHHLNAYRNGRTVKKTENYKLAESLRDHCRDLLLLSATPHQGDHFRFWKLVQLLNPTLFKSSDDMVKNRHRLNSFIFRRTKADACRPDGSSLFARRCVHTESFVMNNAERDFYSRLRDYLQDGFALAKREGNQGRALGFVMAIFQKIAASSFAAVRRTLRRRLINLTIHEAIVKDDELDIESRDRLFNEARALLRNEHNIADDSVGRGEVEHKLSDLKLKILKKLRDEDLALASDSSAGEEAAAAGEEMASMAISIALPEERQRITELLDSFPECNETKVQRLIRGLGSLWRTNPDEKIVIFATYLGTVELIGKQIDSAYPGQGVVVLKGGDHGAKLAAERRFRKPDGPRVLVCTAAGREGINLQFARVLFNFDLPWNPMDLEQRIGRIHRYGQMHTAQVYNLVLSDTIEGRIFLLLDEKLREIARTLGKLDEDGQVAEDLRGQILGQLSERVRYDKLYQAALSDPELKRTKVELEVALSEAKEARSVVWELFQDLEGFNLDDYRPYSDVSAALDRLVRFLRADLEDRRHRLVKAQDTIYEVRDKQDHVTVRFTTDRDRARAREDLELLGLDHPIVAEALERHSGRASEELGVSVASDVTSGVATWWTIETIGTGGERKARILTIAVNEDGSRALHLERDSEQLFQGNAGTSRLEISKRQHLLQDHIEPLLQRELRHKGLVPKDGGISSSLVGWVEVGPSLHLPSSEENQPHEAGLPVRTDVDKKDQYESFLPLYSLEAVAASAPAGEFGSAAVTQYVEPEGWLAVQLGRPLNGRMFICRIRGSSMDNESSNLVDGGLAVFELHPLGSRQNKIVLVRGSFEDPDTGSYAVKKYVADQRGEDGRHQEIRLVSLNPDKSLYPDILLNPEYDEDVQVIASLVTALNQEQHLRKELAESATPESTSKPKTRDLVTEEGRRKVKERLTGRWEKFFEQPPDEDITFDSPDTSQWNSQVVCLDAESGGLHIEIGPLHGLWRFIKRLALQGAIGKVTQLLASNVRLRPTRVAMDAGQGPWYWEAVGFEDDPDIDLTSLSLPALSIEQATVFLVGADGAGRVVTTRQLARTQSYRVLVPPRLWKKANLNLMSAQLPDNWHLLEVENPTSEMAKSLSALGLSLGTSAPTMSFSLAGFPCEWRSNVRGELYACFSKGKAPIIRIDGCQGTGEAELFLKGSQKIVSVSVPGEEPAFVELSGLDPGKYMCSLIPAETSAETCHLPLELLEKASPPPKAGWQLEIANAAFQGLPGAPTTVWSGDLTELELEHLKCIGPPGWSVRVVWKEVSDSYLATLELSESGYLDFEQLYEVIRDRLAHRQLGDLVLDLGELGTAIFQHRERRSADLVAEKLGELLQRREATVAKRAGAFLPLITIWFEPVCRCLGYELDLLAEDPEDRPPVHAAAARLLVTERSNSGMKRRCRRVLILTEGLETELSPEMFAWVDRQCLRCDVNSALLSTGLQWAEHRRRSRLPLEIWNLPDVLEQKSGKLIAFLRDMAEGI